MMIAHLGTNVACAMTGLLWAHTLLADTVVDLNVMFAKDKTVAVAGVSYDDALADAKREKKDRQHVDAVAEKLLDEHKKAVLMQFKSEGGQLFFPHLSDDTLGVVTSRDPQDGQFECQTYATSEAASAILATLASKQDLAKVGAVVAILYAKADRKVLVHAHSEPKSAWGFAQEFWSYAGGLRDTGLINSALAELYEESGFQLPEAMVLRRVRFVPTSRSVAAQFYFEVPSQADAGVQEVSEDAHPIKQFWPFVLKIKDPDTATEQSVVFPRERGTFDYAAVRWAALDLDQETFVQHEAIPEALKAGRFDSFKKPEIKADLSELLRGDAAKQ